MALIATVRLAPGEVGFYDPHTRIYLTNVKPIAQIFDGMNLTTIKTAVKSGRLLLLSGSLVPGSKEEEPAVKMAAPIIPEVVKAPELPPIIPEEVIAQQILEPAKVEAPAVDLSVEITEAVKAPEVKEAEVVAEPVVEEVVAEATAEPVVEPAVEEEVPEANGKRRNRKNKKDEE